MSFPKSEIHNPKSQIPFWKYQAIGNHFPLFHTSDLEDVDLAKLAKWASLDARFGIGGDGILVMQPLKEDTAELRMFNPDGTEDFCGNGLRIAAKHAFDQGWVGPKFTLVHLGREVPSEVRPDGQILTTIGTADYTPANVPVNRSTELFDDVIANIGGKEWRGSSLSTGSTHTIIPVDELPDEAEMNLLGPQFEHLPLFPERTSVIFTKELSPNHLKIGIWERGVGITWGCGTGSSAASADYLRRKKRCGLVLVENSGGNIAVNMDAWNSPITIQGTAELVFQGITALGVHEALRAL